MVSCNIYIYIYIYMCEYKNIYMHERRGQHGPILMPNKP